MIIKD